MIMRFTNKVDPVRSVNNCWEWLGTKNHKGYGMFWFQNKLSTAHRAAYGLFVDEIPEGMMVCHSCDNRGCVNPDHLFVGTHADNMRDMCNKGRRVQKLSDDDVRHIYHSTDTQANLAKQYGVNPSHVSRIKSRTDRRHVSV